MDEIENLLAIRLEVLSTILPLASKELESALPNCYTTLSYTKYAKSLDVINVEEMDVEARMELTGKEG